MGKSETTMSKAIGRRNTFGLAEIERGLLELAMANGSAEAAARVLDADQEAGFKVSPQTLTRWRARDVDRYEAIRPEARSRLMAINSEHHLRVSEEATKVVSKLIKRVVETADELPPCDIPGAARNMSVISGIHADKARELPKAATTEDARCHRSPPRSRSDGLQTSAAAIGDSAEPG
jgi:hypothetical protein